MTLMAAGGNYAYPTPGYIEVMNTATVATTAAATTQLKLPVIISDVFRLCLPSLGHSEYEYAWRTCRGSRSRAIRNGDGLLPFPSGTSIFCSFWTHPMRKILRSASICNEAMYVLPLQIPSFRQIQCCRMHPCGLYTVTCPPSLTHSLSSIFLNKSMTPATVG